MVSDPSESGILPWLGIILSYTFTGFWVLPIFWISKPINSIWFQVSFVGKVCVCVVVEGVGEERLDFGGSNTAVEIISFR